MRGQEGGVCVGGVDIYASGSSIDVELGQKVQFLNVVDLVGGSGSSWRV